MSAQWEGPPDSEHLAGICPNCNLPSTFEPRGELKVSAGEAERWMLNPRAPNISQVRAVVFQCRACFEGCVAIETRVPSTNPVEFKGIHWWPPPGSAKLDASIPSDLSSAFREGMRCLGAAAPHAAAVMYRRTIEGIVRDKGSQKANLVRQILRYKYEEPARRLRLRESRV